MSKVRVSNSQKPSQINALLGIAVMKEDTANLDKIVAEVSTSATLHKFEGKRYVQLVAVDEAGLDAILDIEQAGRNKLRYSMARAVPLDQVQTNATQVEGGGATRLIASGRGLPFQTRYPSDEERAEHPEYEFCFQRPTFWVIRILVDAEGKVTYTGQLMGQYRKQDGEGFEYRPMTRSQGQKITKKAESVEEAAKAFHANEKFLYAMTQSVIEMADSAERKAGFHRSFETGALTTDMATLLPGLEELRGDIAIEESADSNQEEAAAVGD